MPNKSNQKLKLLLILQNLLKNSDENNPIDAAELIQDLEKNGIQAERKSIYKDIEILQSFGYNIMKTRTPKCGYFICERDFELAEIRLLCDAVQAANFISPNKTKVLLSKIFSLTSVSQAEKIEKQVYVENRNKAKNETIYYTIDKLDTAIQNNCKVEIVYRKRKINETNEIDYEEKTHCISPYSLIWMNDHYYLVGNNVNHSNLMITRVDKIKSVKILEDSPSRSFSDVSPYKDKFDSADYVNKHLNMFSGDPQEVELICDNSLIDDILDKFGENVNIFKNGDDKFRITINVAISEGFVSWVLQYGGKIKVKQPVELRTMILDRVDAIKKVYQI